MIDFPIIAYTSFNLIFTLTLLVLIYSKYNTVNYYDTNKQYCKAEDVIEKDFSSMEDINTIDIKAITIVMLVISGVVCYISLQEEVRTWSLVLSSSILLILFGTLLGKIQQVKYNRNTSYIVNDSKLILNSCFANSFQRLPKPVKTRILKNYIKEYEATNPGVIITAKQAEENLGNMVNNPTDYRINLEKLLPYMSIPKDIDEINQEYHFWAKQNCRIPDGKTKEESTCRVGFPYNTSTSPVTVECKKPNDGDNTTYLSTYIPENSSNIKQYMKALLLHIWVIFIVLIYILFKAIYRPELTFYIVVFNIVFLVLLFLYYMFFVRE